MPEFTQNLIRDLTKLLDLSDEYNITILVGDTNGKLVKFQAHSLILRARSPYFKRALSKDWSKKEGEMHIFKKPNISPKVFEIILKYMYTGVVNLDKYSGNDVLKLLVAADELEIVELIDHAQDHLINNKSTWTKQNLVTLLHIMSGHEAFEKLNTHCLETICEEPHLIFKSDDFLSLDEPMLIWLLKRDDLGLDEIEVWDYTIQWGIGNTENLSSHDVLMWTVDDFIALEKTLHQCIPLIRYFEIAADDYAEKVIPYKKILPKNLKKQLLTFHLTAGSEPPLSALPPRVLCATVAIDSVITNPRHAALIASWIKRRLETDISEYKFNLILRGSRDGFSNSIFRQTCAHLSSTVVLIKIRGSGKIIGGYQAGRWFNDYLKKNMDNLLDDDDSILEFPSRRPRQLSNPEMASNLNFLFSLGTGKNLRSVQLSFAEQRIYNSSQRNNNTHSGPFFYNDLFISDQANSNRLSWYQCQTYQPNLFNGQIGQHFFQVEEYEVFQAVVRDD